MTPPDTSFWYHTAYTVAALFYGGYVVSLWWRRRALRNRVTSSSAREALR